MKVSDIKPNVICKDFITGAECTGIEKKEIKAICNGCDVPFVYGVRMRVEKPLSCSLFKAIIERLAIKPLPPPPVRPCDFITGGCRGYVQSRHAFSMAKNVCGACLFHNPGGKDCALSQRLKKGGAA